MKELLKVARRLGLLRILFVLSVFIPGSVQGAPLELASPFGEHMVLQRDRAIPVWGWGEPESFVEVKIAGLTAKAKVGPQGRWKCELSSLKAGGPHTFSVSDGNDKILYRDVLVGEVWIACGQSNMAMGFQKVSEVAELVVKTMQAKRRVRTLNVATMISLEESERCLSAEWSLEPPPSAVAAGFACLLEKAIDVPVAVVLSSWGSSSLEGWMPRDMETQLPHFGKLMETELGGDRLEFCREIIDATRREGTGRIVSGKDFPALGERSQALGAKTVNIFARTRPNLLYNAMLHPLIPMACRGMIYYQGEANGKSYGDMLQYGETQPLWVERLRREWGVGDEFYFLNVMLPGFGRTLGSGPSEGDLEAVDAHSWAIIRESQSKVLELANTEIANTIDLGDVKNIHPRDKYPIGERAAMIARREIYGENDLLAAGPRFREMRVSDSELRLSFEDARGLKTTDGEAPRGFWITDDGKAWEKAEARIVGDEIAIRLDGSTNGAELQVRYAYAAMPDVSLVNEAGLPMYPFRKD